MANIDFNDITKDGLWRYNADRINDNFNKVRVALMKMSVVNLGYFTSFLELTQQYPSADEGNVAWVGTPYPGYVYKFEDGVWVNTGGQAQTETIDLSGYAKAAEVKDLLLRLQGRSVNSDPAADPFMFLGDFHSDSAIRTQLDSLYGTGKQGYYRLNATGLISVAVVALDDGGKNVAQKAEGALTVDGEGRLCEGDEYGVFVRTRTNGAWGAWKRLSGGGGKGNVWADMTEEERREVIEEITNSVNINLGQQIIIQ